MEVAFSWFLGNNQLGQTIYNPASAGCYDGLEEHQVNLNQGAESVVSYLMARMTLEMQKKSKVLAITLVDSHQQAIIRYDVLQEQNAASCSTN
jgi:hypothetical protein